MSRRQSAPPATAQPPADPFNLLPPLSSEEFDALRDSIRRDGMRHPVIVDEVGNVLDGRHRLRIDPHAKRVVMKGLSDAEKQAFVFAANFTRRNLSPAQKEECRAAMKRVAESLRAENAKQNTQQKIAALLGVSRECIRDWFMTNGVDAKGHKPDARVKLTKEQKAEAVARVEAGESQVQVAADYGVNQSLISKLVARENRQQTLTAERAQQNASATGSLRLVKSDAITFLRSIPAGTVDLLITDPPYSTDVDDIAAFAAEWLPLAISRLKPGGRAYVFTGAYVDELHAYTGLILAAGRDGWQYDPPLVWTYRNTIGPTPLMGYKLNWQACFHVYGAVAPPLDCPSLNERFTVQEVNAPDARFGLRDHAWQKPDELAERLIRHAAKAGDLVIDPFAGTGTFVSAAIKANCNVVACDNSDDMLAICRERGLAVSDAA